MARNEDALDQELFIEDEQNDLEEPADGRDGTAVFGSSDDPETLDAMDPLRRDHFLLDGDEDQNGIPDYQERDGRDPATDPDGDGDWSRREEEGDADEDEDEER